jgi:hypothetical protein
VATRRAAAAGGDRSRRDADRRALRQDGAAGNYKGTFGFHPLLAYLDGVEDALAGLLRPGNAGANCAADQIAVLEAALEQLPKGVAARGADPDARRQRRRDARADRLLSRRADRLLGRVRPDEPVREAILALGQNAWVPAIRQDGEPRDDDAAQVAEISDGLDLLAWPAGSRVIVRRERPHPSAQLSFTDHDGHRFQAILTDARDDDIADLEARHRGHASVEDRIKAGKDCGLEKLPFRDFDLNAIWLELVLIAQDLIAWSKALCLDNQLAACAPKRLRNRLLHVARPPRLPRPPSNLAPRPRLASAHELASAFMRLQALPPPTR